jgi:hypothetical protein
MAGPTETISFVARRLIQFEKRFALSDLPQRRTASILFSQISRSIQSMLFDLGREHLPHDACRDLILFSTKLKETTLEELGATEADKLATALGEACDKERIFLEYRNSDHKAQLTEELEKSAILIQALANGIYMAPWNVDPEEPIQLEAENPL